MRIAMRTQQLAVALVLLLAVAAAAPLASALCVPRGHEKKSGSEKDDDTAAAEAPASSEKTSGGKKHKSSEEEDAAAVAVEKKSETKKHEEDDDDDTEKKHHKGKGESSEDDDDDKKEHKNKSDDSDDEEEDDDDEKKKSKSKSDDSKKKAKSDDSEDDEDDDDDDDDEKKSKSKSEDDDEEEKKKSKGKSDGEEEEKKSKGKSDDDASEKKPKSKQSYASKDAAAPSPAAGEASPEKAKFTMQSIPGMIKTPVMNLLRASPMVKALCTKTEFPELCESSIGKLPVAAPEAEGKQLDGVGVLKLAVEAVRAKISEAKAAAAEMMGSPGTDKMAKAAISDCLGLYDDMNSNFDSAVDALGRGDKSTAGVMLDSARTDVDTCENGFAEREGLKNLMADHDKTLAQLSSNVLAINANIDD